MTKYLLYQPNHGVGMELHIFETAARLAQALGRSLVVPRLPQLETNTYERGLDDYFEIPSDLKAVSHTKFLDATDGEIGLHVRIIPEYRPEYRSELNRTWHPTWMNNIDKSPYFELVSCRAGETQTVVVEQEMSATDAASFFAYDQETVAFSYINGLLLDEVGAVPIANDDFNGRAFTPARPRVEYFQRIKDWGEGEAFDAIHVREGYRQLAWEVSGVRLPSLEDFLAATRGNRRLYVATDVEEIFTRIAREVTLASHARRGLEQIDDVATDIAACIAADAFVGTHFSTFSQYISHARRLAGKDDADTHLIRDEAHDADHVYNTYDYGGGVQ